MQLPELRGVDVHADLDAGAKLDALGPELVEAALDDALLDLEVRDTEADEAAARFVSLEDGHRVAGAIQLLRAREPGRTGADYGDAAAGADARRLRDDPCPPPRRGRRSPARSA